MLQSSLPDWLGFAALCALTTAFAVVVRFLVDATPEDDEDAERRPNRRRDVLRRAREEEQVQRDERLIERELKSLEKEEEKIYKLQEQLKTTKAEYKHWESQMKCIPIDRIPRPLEPSDSDLIKHLHEKRISSVGEIARKFRITVKSAIERLECLHNSNVICIYIDRTGLVVIYDRDVVKAHANKAGDLARELRNLYT